MRYIKSIIKNIPLVGPVIQRIYASINLSIKNGAQFPGSQSYWEDRYASGGDSGAGSYGKFAEFKKEVINEFVSENNISTVIEFGCGDGNQLKLSKYDNYIGFDVSEFAIKTCKKTFSGDKSKSFHLMDSYAGETADLTLSLDVIYHLVEDDVFESYMHNLFNAASRFVIIYASDGDNNNGYENTHVKHRKFSNWIAKNAVAWGLNQHIENKYPYNGDYKDSSFSDFYIYKKIH